MHHYISDHAFVLNDHLVLEDALIPSQEKVLKRRFGGTTLVPKRLPDHMKDFNQRAMRRCLGGCERLFMSTDPSNRVCAECRCRLGKIDHPRVHWLMPGNGSGFKDD